MTYTLQSAGRALWAAIQDPAPAARRLLDAQLGLQNLWMALIVVAIVNVLMLALLQAASPAPVIFADQAMVITPFTYAAIISVFLFLLVYTVYHLGRLMGGVGSVADSLAIIVLFQTISVSLEAVQVFLVLISPAIAQFFGMISLAILLRCILHFINEMHGFGSLGKALVVIVLALLGTALIAGMVLAFLGVGPSMVPA
jgi:hypothetical protein